MTKETLLSGRVALVTGASRGFGLAAAKALAEAGAHVIALARTTGALEELDDEIKKAGGTATLVPANLRDFSALDRLGAALFERFKKLDILLGNAAMLGVLTPLPHLDPKLWAELLDVNVTANYRLIRSLDPLLRQSDAGRAVFVTSGAGRDHVPFWGPYAATKAALESLALTYAAECANSSVRVNLFDPGPMRTRLRAKAMPGENPDTLILPEDVVPALMPLFSPSYQANGERVVFRAS
jgi:NAD(P)-dependent dehydrogenase (short-subunit alcohol dehydrogenase family)